MVEKAAHRRGQEPSDCTGVGVVGMTGATTIPAQGITEGAPLNPSVEVRGQVLQTR
jgi:hypothetical protein